MFCYIVCIYLTDSVLQSEIKKRDSEIKDLTEKYSTESKVRTKVEKQKDQLDTKLVCSYQYYCRNQAMYISFISFNILHVNHCREVQKTTFWNTKSR